MRKTIIRTIHPSAVYTIFLPLLAGISSLAYASPNLIGVANNLGYDPLTGQPFVLCLASESGNNSLTPASNLAISESAAFSDASAIAISYNIQLSHCNNILPSLGAFAIGASLPGRLYQNTSSSKLEWTMLDPGQCNNPNVSVCYGASWSIETNKSHKK